MARRPGQRRQARRRGRGRRDRQGRDRRRDLPGRRRPRDRRAARDESAGGYRARDAGGSGGSCRRGDEDSDEGLSCSARMPTRADPAEKPAATAARLSQQDLASRPQARQRTRHRRGDVAGQRTGRRDHARGRGACPLRPTAHSPPAHRRHELHRQHARGDRGGDVALEARDPALLSVDDGRRHAGDGLARGAQCVGTRRRPPAVLDPAGEGDRADLRRTAGLQRLLSRRTFRGIALGARRRRGGAARRGTGGTGDHGDRREIADGVDGRLSRTRDARPRGPAACQ